MKVLVTGGAGYIGSHTARMLAREGFDVLVLDNFSSGKLDFIRGIPSVACDLRDETRLNEIFNQNSIQAVLHFASLIQVAESIENPDKYYQHNLKSSLNLLGAMVKHKVDKLIFSSSAAIYGIPLEIPITEEHPLEPVNPYGQTKKIIETMLRDYDRAYGLKSISLRYFNAAGADPSGEIGELHDPETHLIPNILMSLINPRSNFTVFGDDFPTPDGTCVRDYIHVNDLARAHILALQNLLAHGETQAINLGTGYGHSVLEIIHKTEELTGRKVQYEIGPRRQGDVPVLLAAKDNALRTLGWEPVTSSIDDIIKTAWKWHSRFL